MTIESQKSVWIAAAVLALTFLAGGLAGAAVAFLARRPALPPDIVIERMHLPEVPPAPGAPGGPVFYKRLGNEFGAELGLDDEQATRVDSLMEIQREKADSLLESMEPRLKALMDSTNTAIEAQLTDEQRERFHEMQARRHDVLIRRRVGPGPEGAFEEGVPAPEGEDR